MLMDRRKAFVGLALAAALVAAACGGSSPAAPSGAASVVVQGVVLSGSSGVAAASGRAVSAGNAGKVKVTVDGTTVTAEVAANGTFQLQGVPAGTFTLIFTIDGVEIGRVEITATEGAEVKITVQIESSHLVVIEIKIDDTDSTDTTTPASCIISGGKVGQGIELEGNFSSGTAAAFKMLVDGQRASDLVDVNASAASFRCNGSKASEAECKASLGTGDKIHVRGTLMTCSTTAAGVTATEVKIQK